MNISYIIAEEFHGHLIIIYGNYILSSNDNINKKHEKFFEDQSTPYPIKMTNIPLMILSFLKGIELRYNFDPYVISFTQLSSSKWSKNIIRDH